jgi:hypothetical protein
MSNRFETQHTSHPRKQMNTQKIFRIVAGVRLARTKSFRGEFDLRSLRSQLISLSEDAR